jgi:hypothetical protein
MRVMLVRENTCGNAGAVLAAGPGGESRTTLIGMRSVFERLVYIASLANVGRLPRTEHAAVFEEWLRLGLEQKREDLETYAHRRGLPPHELVREWLQRHSYEALIPCGALRPERELFEMDLEVLLPILAQRQADLKFTNRADEDKFQQSAAGSWRFDVSDQIKRCSSLVWPWLKGLSKGFSQPAAEGAAPVVAPLQIPQTDSPEAANGAIL